MSKKHIEMRFGARTFSVADILWGLEQAKEEGPLAREALALGRNLAKMPISNKDCMKFSETVCRWGRGERVFANLRRHHGPKLGTVLSKALTEASNSTDAQTAIAPLCAIKGLGVSFASKHLRMMLPDRFGVLDSRFEQSLGFALNVPGYALFMKHLAAFRDEFDRIAPTNLQNLPISTIENGLFFLVQPKAVLRLQQERSSKKAL